MKKLDEALDKVSAKSFSWQKDGPKWADPEISRGSNRSTVSDSVLDVAGREQTKDDPPCTALAMLSTWLSPRQLEMHNLSQEMPAGKRMPEFLVGLYST